MNVLIVYGTTEGQTRKIAKWTATYIRDREHHVELRDSAAPMSDLDLGTLAIAASFSFSRQRAKADKVKQLRAAGVGPSGIARQLSISRTSVHRILTA